MCDEAQFLQDPYRHLNDMDYDEKPDGTLDTGYVNSPYSDDTDDELSYDNRIFTLKDKCLAKENQKYSINDIPPTREYTTLEDMNAYNEKYRFYMCACRN